MEKKLQMGIHPETAQELYPKWEAIVDERLPTIEMDVPKEEGQQRLEEVKRTLINNKPQFFVYRFPASKFPTTVLGEDSRTTIQIFPLK